ncbi:response regulator [Ideonella sp.]|uniref:response regulator n=1 Tax=Ideonella sp. TaxID=1929293 RepID=UPI0035B05C51
MVSTEPTFGTSWAEMARRQALVIDANPASRTMLTAMMRELGFGTVVQTSRAQDARRLIEHQRFDMVVCEYTFDNQPMTGQDLMDDLRLAQLLPLSTVVVMISGEAGYAKVAEAAEAALDAYLIKPHTGQALRDRVLQSFNRKATLADIIGCVERGAYEEAAGLCQRRCDTRGPNWLNAARIGAELWLRAGRPQAAQALFETIMTTRAVPWARLGFARSQYQAGGMQQARRTLESLLNDEPRYADAYDVMGKVLLDQGEHVQALNSLRRATALTPGCVSRLLKFGLLAFYHGDPKEAADALQRAAVLGQNSKVFDLQGLVLLGTLQFDRGDLRGLTQSLHAMSSAFEAQPQSARLRRFEATLSTLKLLLERKVAEAVALTHQALRELSEPNYEFEAACNLLSVLSRLHAREVRLDDIPETLTRLADRFTVSRTTCELLCRAAQGRPDFEPLIRARYTLICDQAEAAVSHTVAGEPGRAVTSLLDAAEQSLNGKLMDLAVHTLERHRHGIAHNDELSRRVQALQDRYRSYGTQVKLQHKATRPAANPTIERVAHSC